MIRGGKQMKETWWVVETARKDDGALVRAVYVVSAESKFGALSKERLDEGERFTQVYPLEQDSIVAEYEEAI